MKPYSNYKPSRMNWLEALPAHWQEPRARFEFKEIDERSITGDEELLSVSHITGITPRSEKNVTMFMAESYVGHKLCCPDDLVINSLWTWMGALGISNYRGIVSSAYGVYRFRNRAVWNPRYVDYLARIPGYIGEYLCRSKGVWTSRLAFNTDDFYDLPILMPPATEQVAIVAFLDRKTADIERFITKKQQLIALLNEQKAAIINRAVTRGLNPDTPMKASGVEWLGEVPAHWEVRRLRFLVALNPSKTSSTSGRSPEQQVVFLPMENISVDGSIDNSTKKLIFEVSSGFTFFSRGDVVIAKITPCFENGKGAWLEDLTTDIGFGTTELIVLRPHKEVWAQFLYFITVSSAFRTQGEAMMTGSAGQQRVPTDFVRDYPVALPPFLEQKEITKFIEVEKAKLNEAISRIEREIELIQEYRTTLISDAVTGKIDVREVMDAKNGAANLTT